MSEIGELESPRGAMTTRVDPKLFGRPADFLGDRREWRHFEWVFRNWFGFLYDQAEEWLDEAAVSVVELGQAVPTRRENRQSALHESCHGVQGRCVGRRERSHMQARL